MKSTRKESEVNSLTASASKNTGLFALTNTVCLLSYSYMPCPLCSASLLSPKESGDVSSSSS